MRFKVIVILVLLAAVWLVACSSQNGTVEVTRAVEVTTAVELTAVVTETMEEQMVTLPAVDPFTVDGDIVTAGSSTVFPLTERMVERFQDEGFTGNVTIDSIGTGAGFERFCVSGETDISNASRSIKAEEIASCQAIGREPIEFRVGTDALAVVVSNNNYFATNITLEQLALLFSTAKTWADVNPEWPAHPIGRFSPGTDSGTFDYFVETIFNKEETPLLAAANLQLSEDDNVLAQGVIGDTCDANDLTTSCVVGYFGYAYYEEYVDSLRALSINAVVPSAATVNDNSYPLSRPLFIYSTAKIMAEKPQVAAFINFYLTYVNEEISSVGYFPAGDEALNQARSNWLNAGH